MNPMAVPQCTGMKTGLIAIRGNFTPNTIFWKGNQGCTVWLKAF